MSECICGVDEAGRGPLAGPVVAAAVILDPAAPIDGLMDSKKLSARRREVLAEQIRGRALAWAVAHASVEEIDRLNILQATFLAMQRAVGGLETFPTRVLIDGNQCPELAIPTEAIVKGDSKVAAISAASILAKTARDDVMRELDRQYPEYGFARHMAYGTKAHLEALHRYGPSPCHRRSFKPIKQLEANP